MNAAAITHPVALESADTIVTVPLRAVTDLFAGIRVATDKARAARLRAYRVERHERAERATALAELALAGELAGTELKLDHGAANDRQVAVAIDIIVDGLEQKGRLASVLTTMHGRRLFVQVAVGGNPNTIGDLFKRRGSFSIGPRGGIRAVSYRKGQKGLAGRYPLIYGWEG